MKNECGTQNKCSTGTCSSSHCWCKFSLAFGFTNGLFIFFIGLLGTFHGCCLSIIESLSFIYPGYAPTVTGSFLGAFWGFIITFFFFCIAGGIYRLLCKCCNKCYCYKEKGNCSKDTEIKQ